jgi:simple sugar transport system permease protein
LILLIIGKDPYETFRIMFEYGIRGKSIVSIINRSIPLYISAIAVAVGFKMGLFNIGVEGQYLMGSLVAAYIGAQFSIITPITYTIYNHRCCCYLLHCGQLLQDTLKLKKGIHEVISTIMLNYIGTGLIAYALTTLFDEPNSNYDLPRTSRAS